MNKKQAEAINTPISMNLMISAGAGSGKTKVLSEKVKKILIKKELKPSEILVLTFTNAAAFEMKNRIIKNIQDLVFNIENPLKDKGETAKYVEEELKLSKEEALKFFKKLASELLSAQISTFDSFSSYLVKKYGKVLDIPPTFQIVSDVLIDAKRNEYIDEIFKEEYQKGDKDFKKLIEYTCFRKDTNLRNLLFKLDVFLNGLSLNDENDFLNNYKYLNEDYINNFYDAFYESIMNEYEEAFNEFKANYVNFSENKDFEKFDIAKNKFNDAKRYYNSSDITSFCNLFKEYKFEENRGKLSKIYKTSSNTFKEKLKELIIKIANYPNKDEAINFSSIFHDPNLYLLKMEKVLKEKLSNYKRMTASYTFNDIAKASLRLLKEFVDIKEEIASNFRYIMIDEYQDTNDIQEEFIDSLKGYSTLFVVGDIKQSIYRFRKANPTLFNKRKEMYLGDNNSKVIDMNTNYRSFEKLLTLVNLYFKKNMSLEEGGVDFTENEELVYDEEVNLYDQKQIEAVNNKSPFEYIKSNSFKEDVEFNVAKQEAIMIAFDIKDKIDSNYQVYDKEKSSSGKKLVFRNAKPSDFAILCSRGTKFSVYKKVFEDFNISLNSESDEPVRDINSIIVIESLFKTYLDIIDEKKEEYIFDFLSLGRSYLYEYDDEYLFDQIKNKTYLNDQIFKDINAFIIKAEAKNYLLKDLYHALINDFKVIEKLYKLGNINSNLNRIESLNVLIDNLSNVGKTSEDLLYLLGLIDKYKLDFECSNSIENKDSVTITTIHKSKGLEYRVVYLPLSESNKNKNNSNYDIKITKDYGILYRGFDFGMHYKSLFEKLYEDNEKKEENSEYLRKLYVAFTRAKERMIFVVGDSSPLVINKNSVYKYMKNAYRCIYKVNLDLFDLLYENFGIKYDKELILSLNKFLNFDIKNIDDIESFKNFDISDFVKEFTGYINKLREKLSRKEFEDKITGLSSLEEMSEENITSKKDLVISFLEKYERKLCLDIFLMIYDDCDLSLITNPLEKRTYKALKQNPPKKDIGTNVSKFLLFLKYVTKKKYSPILELNFEGFENINFDNEKVPSPNKSINKLPEIEISDKKIKINEKEDKRASHKIDVKDEDFYLSNLLKEGIRFHYLMELYDFKKKDLSYIKDEKEKEIISKVVNLDIFKDSDKAKVYKEYEYLDDNQKGSIDLLLVYDDHIDIIDYKTKNIDDEAYPRQLNIYKNNIFRLFKKDNIKMYLISLINAKVKEID